MKIKCLSRVCLESATRNLSSMHRKMVIPQVGCYHNHSCGKSPRGRCNREGENPELGVVGSSCETSEPLVLFHDVDVKECL